MDEKILIACNAGISTSMLVRDMRVVAQNKGVTCDIDAKDVGEAKRHLDQVDLLILSPQVRHEESIIHSLKPELPVYVMEMKDYGALNSSKILENAMNLLDD